MPRHISGAIEGQSFRAVVTTTRTTAYHDGVTGPTESTVTAYYGPYSRKGQAQTMMEVSTIQWRKVEDK